MAIRSYQGVFPVIHSKAYIDPASEIIGKVSVGADSSVWPMVVVRGDVNVISIGKETNIQDGAVLHVTHASKFVPDGHSLHVADRVTVGHNATLHACRVGSNSLIGMGSVVLDGAVIESEVMLGAGSLVPMGKTLGGGYLWMGSPVQRIRPLKEKEREFLAYSASHYVKLAAEYAAQDVTGSRSSGCSN